MVTAELYPDALEILNKWYDEGHIITFFTSRTEAHRVFKGKFTDLVMANKSIEVFEE